MQLLLKINAYFSRFYCYKNLPWLWVFSSFRTGAGLRPKKCGRGTGATLNVRCADESRGARWSGQKAKLSPSAEMLKSTPLLQLQAVVAYNFVNWLCKTKKKVVVSIHNFLCIPISRWLPNLKKKYMTAFKHKLIHNCITQSKASRRKPTLAANDGNIKHLRAIITSRTVCTFKMMYCTVSAAALQQLWIYDLFDDCWLHYFSI